MGFTEREIRKAHERTKLILGVGHFVDTPLLLLVHNKTSLQTV